MPLLYDVLPLCFSVPMLEFCVQGYSCGASDLGKPAVPRCSRENNAAQLCQWLWPLLARNRAPTPHVLPPVRLLFSPRMVEREKEEDMKRRQTIGTTPVQFSRVDEYTNNSTRRRG